MSFTYNSHIPSQTEYHWSGPSPIPKDSTVNHHLNLIESNDSEWMTFWIISWSENLPASAKLRKSLKHQPLSSGPVFVSMLTQEEGFQKSVVCRGVITCQIWPQPQHCAPCVFNHNVLLQCHYTVTLLLQSIVCYLIPSAVHYVYTWFINYFPIRLKLSLIVYLGFVDLFYIWTQFTLSCTCTLKMWSYLRHNYIHMY